MSNNTRAYLTIRLSDGGLVKINEITPFDFKQILMDLSKDDDKTMSDITENEWNDAWVNHGIITGKGQPNADEQELIEKRFLFVNAAFFNIHNNTSRHGITVTDRRELSTVIQQLNTLCAGLIIRHHQDVWHYGWSFFNLCLELHKDNG